MQSLIFESKKLNKASLFHRLEYKYPVFLYVSDDIDWGKANLIPKNKRYEDLFLVGEGEISTRDQPVSTRWVAKFRHALSYIQI